MRRGIGYALVGLLAYGGFLALELPVAVLLPYVAPHLPGFTVARVDGSLLAGQAESVSLRNAQLERLNWRWRPLALLQGQLAYRLVAADPQLTLQSVAGVDWTGAVHWQNIRGELPLRKALMLAMQAQLPVNGTLVLALDDIRLNKAGLPDRAEGNVEVRNLRTTLGRPLALGDFAVQLTTQSQGIVGTVTDKQGPLQVQGSLTLAADGRYRFNGRVGLRDNNNDDLRQALALLGRPGADGQWKIDINGVLRR